MKVRSRNWSKTLRSLRTSKISKELKQFASEAKKGPLSGTFRPMWAVGLTLGVLFGKMFSQTINCQFEPLQLSFKNMYQLWSLLQKWMEETKRFAKPKTQLQARKRKQTSIGTCMRGNLENMFLQCPKPLPQQVSHFTQQLGLEKNHQAATAPNERI